MNYNIFSSTAPAMPKPSKGTEFVKLAISQASKDMREVLIPMAIPALAAHLTDYDDRRFQDSYVHQEGTCLDVLSRELPSHSCQPSDGLDSPLHPTMGGAADDGIHKD